MNLTLERPVDDATRREFLIASVSLAALLAACGDDDGVSSPTAAATRTVTGSRARVNVPVAPQRVAALVGSADVDVMLLGLEPVFSGTFAEGWVSLPEHTVTSDSVPPSPEAVAAARPDLLLGWDWLVDDAAWPALSAIAPAVTIPDTDDWRAHFELVADAVNRQAEGAGALAAFDARVAALGATLKPISVALIGTFEPGAFWWWDADYVTNRHLASLGFDIVAPAATLEGVSTERLGEITAPWIVLTGTPGTDDGTDELMQSPLWSTLPAVQAGQVVTVERSLWGGAGLLWANALLDDIERRFPPSA